MSEDKLNEVEGGVSRRSIAKAAAWAVPAVTVMGAAPSAAVSPVPNTIRGIKPTHIDGRPIGYQATGKQGEFSFHLPKEVNIPRMCWEVSIVPVPNKKGQIDKKERPFRLEDVDDNGGSAKQLHWTPENGKKLDQLDYKYNPSTGVETISFCTEPVESDVRSGTQRITFKIYTGITNIFGNGRADKVIVKGWDKSGQVVDYDSVEASNAPNDENYDGRV
ncbi:hypothetical protein KRX53_07555 [Dermabacteraceae bacterium TAE3-ERU5]|nr:hypothetical protein [Dermabacteraceae bacterium TAE3-ERU5]